MENVNIKDYIASKLEGHDETKKFITNTFPPTLIAEALVIRAYDLRGNMIQATDEFCELFIGYKTNEEYQKFRSAIYDRLEAKLKERGDVICNVLDRAITGSTLISFFTDKATGLIDVDEAVDCIIKSIIDSDPEHN